MVRWKATRNPYHLDLKMVGLGCSVAGGMGVVKRRATFVTKAKGGRSAVREVAEYILTDTNS